MNILNASMIPAAYTHTFEQTHTLALCFNYLRAGPWGVAGVEKSSVYSQDVPPRLQSTEQIPPDRASQPGLNYSSARRE